MNKKLIATAIAAAMIAPAAFADATMYGLFHVAVDSVDSSSGTGAEIQDNWLVRDNASRFGIKGSEDLGNGLKAIYQFEAQINVDGGSAQASTGTTMWAAQRNTFVGLSGGFGTFLVGRHDTPAKIALYAAGNELLGDSIIDFNSGTNGVFSEVRANNAIAYVSPNFSGFTAAAAIVPGEESTDPSGNQSDGLMDHYSLGLMYAGGGLKASVSYEELDNQADGIATAATPNVDRETIQAGASYTFGAFQIGAQYETQDNAQATGQAGAFTAGNDRDAWGLFGKATFGNNDIMLTYTQAETENSAGAKTEDTDGWGIAASHAFSKRTKVYAAYATEEDDAVTAAATRKEIDEFSLGMIHSF